MRIFGCVQGVFYRQSAVKQAVLLNLVGVVRNCDDGSVELIAEGNELDLEKMIVWCRRGSPSARVEKIEIQYSDPSGGFVDFGIGR